MKSSPERCLSGLGVSGGIIRCLELDPTLGSLSLDLGLELELGTDVELQLELGLELEEDLRPRLASRRHPHLGSPPRQHRPQSRCRLRSDYRWREVDLEVALVRHRWLDGRRRRL